MEVTLELEKIRERVRALGGDRVPAHGHKRMAKSHVPSPFPAASPSAEAEAMAVRGGGKSQTGGVRWREGQTAT